jgi:hypothetical protein
MSGTTHQNQKEETGEDDMAKEKISRTICDRCARVVEELDTGKEDETGAPSPKYYVEVNGTKALAFDDLCKKCDDRVTSLLEDMKLEKPEGKKKGKGKSKKTKDKPPAKDSKKEEPAPTGEKPVS